MYQVVGHNAVLACFLISSLDLCTMFIDESQYGLLYR